MAMSFDWIFTSAIESPIIATKKVELEFTIKRLEKTESKVVDGIRLEPRVRLLPENSDFDPIEITENMVFQVWGVVTYTIHRAK